MSAYEKKQFALNRPNSRAQPSDDGLIEVVASLRRQLHKGIHGVGFGRLSDEDVSQIALIVVDFAEDIHDDLGLWKALESAQNKLHGTPLPFIVPVGSPADLKPFDERRIRYLLSVGLEMLLRRHKGQYYRLRFPAISFVGN